MTYEQAKFILRHGSAEGLQSYLEAITVIENEITRQQAEIENYIKVAERQQSLSLERCFEIKRLRAEIEKIKIKLNSYKEENDCLRGYIGIKTEHQLKGIVAEYKGVVCTAKSEARREFAERLIAKADKAYYHDTYMCVDVYEIDNLLKELDGAEG